MMNNSSPLLSSRVNAKPRNTNILVHVAITFTFIMAMTALIVGSIGLHKANHPNHHFSEKAETMKDEFAVAEQVDIYFSKTYNSPVLNKTKIDAAIPHLSKSLITNKYCLDTSNGHHPGCVEGLLHGCSIDDPADDPYSSYYTSVAYACADLMDTYDRFGLGRAQLNHRHKRWMQNDNHYMSPDVILEKFKTQYHDTRFQGCFKFACASIDHLDTQHSERTHFINTVFPFFGAPQTDVYFDSNPYFYPTGCLNETTHDPPSCEICAMVKADEKKNEFKHYPDRVYGVECDTVRN